MATASNVPTSMDEWEYMFKLLIVGNSGVGKTALLFRYVDNSFSEAFISTVGIDFKVKTVVRQGKKIKLQIWDTAGQERYKAITSAYFRGAMGFLLVFDIMNRESFDSVRNWCSDITSSSWTHAQMVLVGNKKDLAEIGARQVSKSEAESLAEELRIQYFETSAKENIDVSEAFTSLVDSVLDKMLESLDHNDLDNMDPVIKQAIESAPGRIDEEPAENSCSC
ncbi:ras-related protein Rab-3-like [Sycon ciliatum]|uniref:ras-related protein Rab-3-like n=1 Tax=Sycon ciliatum TaxID=27933 RepID=UPI0020AAE702|eukprot:scpid81406/ scgid20899/ Ras-related protein Rab-3